MTTITLRYISVGLVVALSGPVWGDAIYMFSRQDGSVYFSGAPAAPRFSTYNKAGRSDRRLKRLSMSVPSININSILPDKSRYEPLVDEVARGYQVDSALLHAVISVESRYNPNALSPVGAVGLMQLMPATARRYGVDDALDPEQNLRGGAKYLRDLLKMFGSDIRLALAAYHAGENAVVKYQNNIPPFESTMQFVSRVLELYEKYRGIARR